MVMRPTNKQTNPRDREKDFDQVEEFSTMKDSINRKAQQGVQWQHQATTVMALWLTEPGAIDSTRGIPIRLVEERCEKQFGD